MARVKPDESVSAVILRAAQGALRVADIWFTMRTRSVESATEEVELYLAGKQIPFERNQPLVGRSGRTWRPDFHTRMRRHKNAASQRAGLRWIKVAWPAALGGANIRRLQASRSTSHGGNQAWRRPCRCVHNRGHPGSQRHSDVARYTHATDERKTPSC